MFVLIPHIAFLKYVFVVFHEWAWTFNNVILSFGVDQYNIGRWHMNPVWIGVDQVLSLLHLLVLYSIYIFSTWSGVKTVTLFNFSDNWLITEFDQKSKCVNFINYMAIRTADISTFFDWSNNKAVYFKMVSSCYKKSFFIHYCGPKFSFPCWCPCWLCVSRGMARYFEIKASFLLWHLIQCHKLQCRQCSILIQLLDQTWLHTCTRLKYM